jgi:hypothetical protein
MKPYIKDLLIIALILLCFLIGCNWNKRDVRDNSTTDTLYVKGKETIRVDTVEVFVFVKNPKPIKTVAVDSLNRANSPQLNLCDSIREYTSSIDDSSGLVVVNSTVQGQLIKQDITLQVYRDSIFRTDTVKITKTITKNQSIVAPFVNFSLDNSISGGLLVQNKRNLYGASYSNKGIFSVFYGINLNKK